MTITLKLEGGFIFKSDIVFLSPIPIIEGSGENVEIDFTEKFWKKGSFPLFVFTLQLTAQMGAIRTKSTFYRGARSYTCVKIT
jgi:hypothetical protein